MRGTIVRIGVSGAGALLAVGLLAVPQAGATGSGKKVKSERSSTAGCFDTSGKTQGRSHSDPDGMTNGGADKPGCAGGFDADRDGNNGCGNDADREDDNNGRCGRQKASRDDRAKAARATKVRPAEVKGDRKARCERDDPKGPTPSTSTTTSTTTPSPAGVILQAAGSVPAPAVLAASAAPAPEVATTTTTTTSANLSAAGPSSPAGLEAASTTVPPQTEVLGETLSQPSILARTGAGVGGLALLGGLLCGGGRLALLARRFLRID